MPGLGTDIVEIERLRHWKDDDCMLSLVFSSAEREAALGRGCCRRLLAAGFAVKEAFMKAAGTGWGDGLQWTDIEALFDGRMVRLRLHNRARVLCGGGRVFASCAYEGELAVAVVVIDGPAGRAGTEPSGSMV
jgi:holo-[acyl-carrier protein] synthase